MTALRFEQPAKQLVWDFNQAICDLKQPAEEGLARYCCDDFKVYASHPINELHGHAAVIDAYYAPLRRAMPDLSRRTQLLFGADYAEAQWVTVIGHYCGSFREALFGIAPSGKTTFLRFGEFYKLRHGRIESCHLMLDLLDLMRQAGLRPVRESLGLDILIPGPATGDGIVTSTSSPSEGLHSMQLVVDMIAGLMRYDPATRDLGVMAHADFWQPDFMWYGPSGIGTTRGIDGFIAGHQRPFLDAFPDRKGGNHVARLADGNYVATFGWPSIRATHAGGSWLGLAPTGKPITMRVMDWWRREGERLAENWVLIDIPDLLRQLGIELFPGEQESLGA